LELDVGILQFLYKLGFTAVGSQHSTYQRNLATDHIQLVTRNPTTPILHEEARSSPRLFCKVQEDLHAKGMPRGRHLRFKCKHRLFCGEIVVEEEGYKLFYGK